MKGGVIVKGSLNPDYTFCHGSDCVPAAMYDLGLADRESATLIANSYPDGVDPIEIITILKRAYGGDYDWRMFRVSPEAIAYISRILNPHEGIIGFVSLPGGRSHHVIVIFKDDTDELFIRDPQYSNVESLDKYVRRMQVDQIGVIDTRDSVRVSVDDGPKITEELMYDLVNEKVLPEIKFRMIRPKKQRRLIEREGGRKTHCRKKRCKTRKRLH
jgi:hypothetical protein